MSGTRSPGCCQRQTRPWSGLATGCARIEAVTSAAGWLVPIGTAHRSEPRRCRQHEGQGYDAAGGPGLTSGVLAGLGPDEAAGLGAGLGDGGAEGEPAGAGISFLQLEPDHSVVEQPTGPHGPLNPGKKA
jgi:hypothetical protein